MAINELQIDFVGKHSAFCINQSGLINSYILGINVARSAVVPALATKVFFSASPVGSEFYVNQKAAATVSVGDVIDGSASEFCPEGRKCTPGDTISIISPAACVVTLSFYK